jgi:fibronectin type 3 domain-containing protein
MKWMVILFLCLPACGQTWFSNVTKSPTTNSCTVHWMTAVPTVGHIEYGTTAGSYGKYTSNTTTYSTKEAQTIVGLTPATTYHFKLVAADSTKTWITSLDSTCVTATATAQHSAKLNWRASTSRDVSRYEVYRTTISGGYYGLLASTTGLSYTDNSVQAGDSYYYVVTAYTSAGLQSGYSNQVKAVIP